MTKAQRSTASALRISGIDKPILLLSPATENNIEKLILNDITLSVSTIKEIILIAKIRRICKVTFTIFVIFSSFERNLK